MSETREKIKEVMGLEGFPNPSETRATYIAKDLEKIIDKLESLIAEREKEIYSLCSKKLQGVRQELNKPHWNSVEEINHYLDKELNNA